MLKCYDFLGDCITTLLVFDYPEFQELLLNTFQSRNVGVKSVGTKVDFWEKMHLKFLTSQEIGVGGEAFAGCILGECNGFIL